MTTDEKIDKLTEVVTRLVEKQVSTVMPVTPVTPSNTADHDLLNRLDQKVDGLKVDIASLSDGTSKQLKDHEDRLRINGNDITMIKTWGTALVFVLSILEFVISKFVQ